MDIEAPRVNHWPAVYPRSDEFPADDVSEQTLRWRYRKKGNGENFGKDKGPEEGLVIVGWEWKVLSAKNVGSHGRFAIVAESLDIYRAPKKLHVGVRLEPIEGFLGVGGEEALLEVEATVKLVSDQKWLDHMRERGRHGTLTEPQETELYVFEHGEFSLVDYESLVSTGEDFETE
jgi:hypothetical protein